MKTKPHFFFTEFYGCKIAKVKIEKKLLTTNKIFEIGPVNQKNKNKIIELTTPKTIKFADNKTKKLIFNPNSTAEIFEYKNITQILFSITKKTNQTKNNNETILISKFKNLKELKNFCINVNLTFETSSIKSALHKFEHKKSFVLTISTKNDLKTNLTPLLAEFNATIETGKFQKAIVEEHCLSIFKNNAIEKTSIV